MSDLLTNVSPPCYFVQHCMYVYSMIMGACVCVVYNLYSTCVVCLFWMVEDHRLEGQEFIGDGKLATTLPERHEMI